MGNEKRLAAIGYGNYVINLNDPEDDPLTIPKHALETLAKFFLEEMIKDYSKNKKI